MLMVRGEFWTITGLMPAEFQELLAVWGIAVLGWLFVTVPLFLLRSLAEHWVVILGLLMLRASIITEISQHAKWLD